VEVGLEERQPAAPALRHLRGALFEPGEQQAAADESVRAWTAPTREIEAREALREVKRLQLRGVPAGEIALLTPNPEAYHQAVELAAEEYGVPVSLETRLAANPAVQALSLLAGLSPDFPWRTTLEALRSPYIRQGWLTAEQVNTLERASRERPVVQGREQWLFALDPRRESGTDEPVEKDIPASAPREDELEAVRTGLLGFFKHLTPPLEASHREYTLWLQERILGLSEGGEDGGQAPVSLDLVGCAAAGEFAARDLPAMGVFMQHLRALVDGCEVVFHGTSGLVTWQAYRTDLLGMLQALTSPVNEGGVRFGRLEAAREQPVDYLLILGLSEGEFPAPPAPDPLYSSAERRLHPLPLRRREDGADASLFWLALSSCRRELRLFRPRLDASGVPWQPSPFWDAVTNVLALEVNDLPIAHLPTLETAASPAELLAALQRGGAGGAPAELASAWQAAQRAAGVIALRQGWAPAPVYEGRLQAADVTAEIAGRYHPRYNWSPSRLNRYGACPFGFFAQYVLDLESRPDPEEGMDAMRRGTLLHTLLEHVFRRAQEQGLDPLPENQSRFLDLLAQVCGEIFPLAPRDFGFRPDALWRYEQQELRRLLRAELAWECQQGGAYRPLRQELRFGLPQSEAGPVGCTTSDGEVFYLHGVIDRVDEVVDGGGLRVLDYKSGSTPYSLSDIREGRALQAPLYALAAEYTLGRRVAESAYLLIPRRELSGKMSLPAGAAADENVQIAVDRAGSFVRAVRAGQFQALPGKPGAGLAACSALCDFASLCRTDRRAIAKVRGSAA
jgi:ATP-dependent helicase/DNAse subunit B